MSDERGEALSTAAVFEEMEVLEPYTAGELASILDASTQRVRNLLEKLATSGKIRRKEPEPDRRIWIREAPVADCPDCGYRSEVKFLHPVLSAVRYCPRCGNRL